METKQKKGNLNFFIILVVMTFCFSSIALSYEQINPVELDSMTYNYLQGKVHVSNPSLSLTDFDSVYRVYNGNFNFNEDANGLIDYNGAIGINITLDNRDGNSYDYVRDGFLLNDAIVENNRIISPLLIINNNYNYELGEEFDRSFLILKKKTEKDYLIKTIRYNLTDDISFCIKKDYVDNIDVALGSGALNYSSRRNEIVKNTTSYIMKSSILNNQNSKNCFAVPYSCYIDSSHINAPYSSNENVCQMINGRTSFALDNNYINEYNLYKNFFSIKNDFNFNINYGNNYSCGMDEDSSFTFDTSYIISDAIGYDESNLCYAVNVKVNSSVVENGLVVKERIIDELYYGIASVVVNEYSPVYNASMLDVNIDKSSYNENESVLITIKAIPGTNLSLNIKSKSEEKNYNNIVGNTAFLVFNPKYVEDYKISANLTSQNISKKIEINFSVKQKLSCTVSGPSEAFVNESINFYSSASGGSPEYGYRYTFENSKISNDKNPVYNYLVPGDYRINLMVTDSSNKIVNCYHDIKIKNMEYTLSFDISDIDNNPIGDVDIIAKKNGIEKEIKTNLNGKASLQLTSGEYNLKFIRDGYIDYNVDMNLTQDTTASIDLNKSIKKDEIPTITIRSLVNGSTIDGASLSVSFDAESSIGIEKCTLLLSDSFRKGFLNKDEIEFEGNQTTVSSTLVSELYNGPHTLKILCENKYYSQSTEEYSFTVENGLVDNSITRLELKEKYEEESKKRSEEMMSLNAITGNVVRETPEQLEARAKEVAPKYVEAEERLDGVLDKLNNVEYQDRIILNKLPLFKDIPTIKKNVAVYKTERLDLNNFDFSDSDEQSQSAKIGTKLMDDMKKVAIDFEITDKKRTVILLSDEDIEKSIKDYMNAKELRSNPGIDEASLNKIVKESGLKEVTKDAKNIQNQIVLNVDLMKVKVFKFDGTIENIIVVNKVLEFSDNEEALLFNHLKLIELIPSQIAPSYDRLEVVGDYELIKNNLVIAFPIQVDLDNYRDEKLEFTYYIKTDAGISTFEDEVLSVVSKDLSYNSSIMEKPSSPILTWIMIAVGFIIVSVIVFLYYRTNNGGMQSNVKNNNRAVPAPKPKVLDNTNINNAQSNQVNAINNQRLTTDVPGVAFAVNNVQNTNMNNNTYSNETKKANVNMNNQTAGMNSEEKITTITSNINPNYNDLNSNAYIENNGFSNYINKAKNVFSKKTESEKLHDLLNSVIDLHKMGRGEEAIEIYSEVSLLYDRCCPSSKEKLSPIMNYLSMEMDANMVSKTLKNVEELIEEKDYTGAEKTLIKADSMIKNLPENTRIRFGRKYDNIKIALSLNNKKIEIQNSIDMNMARKKRFGNEFGIVLADDFGKRRKTVNDELFS